MNILCLCPTYGRPRLVANAVACFLAQDHPSDQRHLLILDDAGQIDAHGGEGWSVISTNVRFPSLPAKYNSMLQNMGVLDSDSSTQWDAIAVWDDDDIYLPWHLSSAARTIRAGAPAAKPASVWSLYGSSEPYQESATGRFHGSLVASTARIQQIGGWISTRRADFDQQQIAACDPWDMLPHSPSGLPSYVFRWQSTHAPHCQGLMSSPDNEDWYDRYQPADRARVEQLVPAFDAETVAIYERFESSS